MQSNIYDSVQYNQWILFGIARPAQINDLLFSNLFSNIFKSFLFFSRCKTKQFKILDNL